MIDGQPQLLNHYHAVKNLFNDMHALTRHPNHLWPHLVAKSLSHLLLLPLQWLPATSVPLKAAHLAPLQLC